ncbi:MAG: RagB/SusD family nutrient uptake outer membrane protein [Dysgonamonadaceae bacterium]
MKQLLNINSKQIRQKSFATFRYMFILMVLTAPFTSCNDFFNVEKSTFIEQEAFTSDASWPESSMASLYKTFHTEYYQFDMFVNGDVASDVCYAGGDNTANFEIDDYNISTTNGNVKRDWGYLYNGVMIANSVLEGADQCTVSGFTDSARTVLKGEAKFVRAVHYFNLVRLWGGVPIVLSTNINETQYLPRSTQDEVYQQIVADLTDAISALPDKQNMTGRATKAAAEGMLAKVYASMATIDYSKVLQYCNAVLSDSQYSLVSNYAYLFDGNHENSSESLFEIQFDAATAGAWGPQMFLPPSVSGDGWKKFNTPSKTLIKAYESENDSVREAASVIFENCTGYYSDDVWGTYIPFAYKFKSANGWNSSNNIIYLRLADIILLKAEALNETGDLSGAKTLLNKIRERVKLSDKNPGTQSDMRLAIEQERFLELAFEGHRWFDLKRTGRAVAVMSQCETRKSASVVYGSAITSTDLLWPIPATAIQLNSSLTQNDGY